MYNMNPQESVSHLQLELACIRIKERLLSPVFRPLFIRKHHDMTPSLSVFFSFYPRTAPGVQHTLLALKANGRCHVPFTALIEKGMLFDINMSIIHACS